MSIERQLAVLPSARATVDLTLLFGSVGEGGAQPGSDFDAAVLGKRKLTASTKKARACLSSRPVDLIDPQETRGLLLRQILHGGMRLFCNGDVLHTEPIKRGGLTMPIGRRTAMA